MVKYKDGRIEGKNMIKLESEYLHYKDTYGESHSFKNHWIFFDYDEKNGFAIKKEAREWLRHADYSYNLTR